MGVCKHGCHITRSLIGYVLPDTHFDWLVQKIRACIKKINFAKSKFLTVSKTSVFHASFKRVINVHPRPLNSKISPSNLYLINCHVLFVCLFVSAGNI